MKPTGKVAEMCPGVSLRRWAGAEQRIFRLTLNETSGKAAWWKVSIHYLTCIYASCSRLDDELLSGHGTIMFTLIQRLTSLSKTSHVLNDDRRWTLGFARTSFNYISLDIACLLGDNYYDLIKHSLIMRTSSGLKSPLDAKRRRDSTPKAHTGTVTLNHNLASALSFWQPCPPTWISDCHLFSCNPTCDSHLACSISHLSTDALSFLQG